METLADRLAMGVGRRHRDRILAEVAVGRDAGDDTRMGIDAEPGRQRSRIGKRIAGGRLSEVAGNIEREGLAFVGTLVCDGGCGRPAVADSEVEALADRLAVGVGRRDSDRVVAEVAVGRSAGDNAGMGIDAQAGRQRGRVGQRITGGRSGEMAGGIEAEALTLVGALVVNSSCGRTGIADSEVEALADGLAVGIGRRDSDWVVAEVAVGRSAGDDAGMGIDAQAGRQGGRVGQRITGGRSGEMAGGIEAEALTLVGALVVNSSCGRTSVADSEVEALADGLTVGIGRRDSDWVVAEVAVGRSAGDDAGMGIDAQAGRQGGRVGQRITGGRGGEVAGDIEAETLTLVGALVVNSSCGRTSVADSEVEALADGLTVGIGRRDSDWVVAEVAVGRSAGDDAGMGIDAQAGRQGGRVGQRITGGRSGEMAGGIEAEALTLVGALVCDGGRGRTSVAVYGTCGCSRC